MTKVILNNDIDPCFVCVLKQLAVSIHSGLCCFFSASFFSLTRHGGLSIAEIDAYRGTTKRFSRVDPWVMTLYSMLPLCIVECCQVFAVDHDQVVLCAEVVANLFQFADVCAVSMLAVEEAGHVLKHIDAKLIYGAFWKIKVRHLASVQFRCEGKLRE